MTLNATAGDPLANTYCTVTEATTFLQDRLHVEAWYRGDPEEAITTLHRREAALMQATRMLDTQVRWYGSPVTETQALAWPQAGQVDALGRLVSEATIPAQVARATAYYALALLEATDALEAQTEAAVTGGGVIKSKKIGDTTITYQDASSTSSSSSVTMGASTRIPADVSLLLAPYGLVPGRGIMALMRS